MKYLVGQMVNSGATASSIGRNSFSTDVGLNQIKLTWSSGCVSVMKYLVGQIVDSGATASSIGRNSFSTDVGLNQIKKHEAAGVFVMRYFFPLL